MTDSPLIDPVRLRTDLADAEAALRAFAEGPARDPADVIAGRFAQTGGRIARSLSRAASDGRITMKELAKTVLEELARIALPTLLDRLGGAGSAASLFGARAAGGPVVAGGAYLVGERGPELFTPRHAGTIAPSSAAAVTIHLNVSPGADVEGFLRHRGQIAADIARAVAYGRRNL